MAFKDFTRFSEAINLLQSQLDNNALIVRIVNRVSNIITNAKTIPSEYTQKYNGVQLLQYNAEGELQDVTPPQQLTIPESVLKRNIAEIVSNRRLIASDLKILNESFNDNIMVDAFPPSIASYGSSIILYSNMLLSVVRNDYTPRITLQLSRTPSMEIEDQRIEVVFYDTEKGEEIPTHYNLHGFSWVNVNITCLQVKGTPDNPTGDTIAFFVQREKPYFDDFVMDTNLRTVGTLVNSVSSQIRAGCHVRIKLRTAESEGIVSSPGSITQLRTNDSRVFYTNVRNTEDPCKVPVLNSDPTQTTLSSFLYPEVELNNLVDSLQ